MDEPFHRPGFLRIMGLAAGDFRLRTFQDLFNAGGRIAPAETERRWNFIRDRGNNRKEKESDERCREEAHRCLAFTQIKDLVAPDKRSQIAADRFEMARILLITLQGRAIAEGDQHAEIKTSIDVRTKARH